ncbi:MAG TPA: FkbM family methyltransferase [Solirubrobacteraceae bacterium]|jgi:FkbM family methyltransferase|nr:FkbM family methyltransferase [Solirubrobacteraceae bacterium]
MRPAPDLVHLGSPYGGWVIPGGMIEPSWICYSVGAGGDIGFDLDLIERYGITVRAFDAVAGYVEDAIAQAAGEPCFTAHHAAIATSDGPVRMQLTHDPHSRSVSSAGLYESARFVELPGRTLSSLMAELGDDHIDLLKLDIEGGEYELMPTLSLRDLGTKVFAVQLHHTGSVRDAHGLIARLHEEGYEPVACRPAVKIAFADRDLL